MEDKYLQKMYLEEYQHKIFEEFKKSNGINDKVSSITEYYDLFCEWAALKRRAAQNYVQLFVYMKDNDDLPTHLMAEFNKGIFDTIAQEMAIYTEYQPIVISRYATTIPESTGITAYTGELSVMDDDVFVSYARGEEGNPNCNPFINDDIDTLITQTPFDYASIYPFTKLLDSEKTLFIGAYGSLNDKDREENLQKISILYHELSDIGYRNINYCSETQDNFYLSAIRISSKQKVLRKLHL